MYPSTDLLMVAWGADRFPEARWAVETPANLQAVLPVVIVVTVDGSPDVVTLDDVVVDVDVYAGSRAEADELARVIRVAVALELPGSIVVTSAGRARVLRSKTRLLPVKRPTTDPGLSRIGGSYELRVQSR